LFTFLYSAKYFSNWYYLFPVYTADIRLQITDDKSAVYYIYKAFHQSAF